MEHQHNDYSTVAIIVLNWNGYDETSECLKSVKSDSYPNKEIIVVDNGSTDGSGKQINQNFPDTHTVFNLENLGFAGGVNVGIRTAQKLDADYILLMNNDVTTNNDFIQSLVTVAQNRKAAAVSGVIRTNNGEIWNAGGSMNEWVLKLKIDRTVPEQPIRKTEFVSGALMLIPMRAINELGTFDESFFFGMEDKEFCRRARRNGWEICVAKDAEVFHKGSASSGSRTPFRYYHSTRNRLQYARSIPSLKRNVFYFFFILTRLFRFVQWCIGRKFNNILAVLCGLIDHIKANNHKKPEDFGMTGPGN